MSSPFVRQAICMNSPQATQNTQLKNDTYGLVSKLVEIEITESHMANCT